MFPFYPMKALARYVLQDQVFELGKGERESIRFEIIYDYSQHETFQTLKHKEWT